jgi:hypothetical protein
MRNIPVMLPETRLFQKVGFLNELDSLDLMAIDIIEFLNSSLDFSQIFQGHEYSIDYSCRYHRRN